MLSKGHICGCTWEYLHGNWGGEHGVCSLLGISIKLQTSLVSLVSFRFSAHSKGHPPSPRCSCPTMTDLYSDCQKQWVLE